jgi:glycogen debranching enzyme
VDLLVTREGELFQVSDRRGDFSADHATSGLFTRDTRVLSRFELLVNGEKPQLFMVTTADDYIQRAFYGAAGVDEALFHRLDLGIERRRVLYGGVMYERVVVTNYARRALAVAIELRFDADFASVFEVRGLPRPARGERLPAQVQADSALLGYHGLDGIVRQTELRFGASPSRMGADRALWHLNLPPVGAVAVDIAVRPAENGAFAEAVGYDHALAALANSYADWRRRCTTLESDSDLLNRVLERSLLDLRVLFADRGHGPFVVAGIPWFAVPFGRDSLIVAMQTLPLNPDLARGTLRTMAELQGRMVDARRREEPGKIPHEMRADEMSNLGEVPFGRYYGSVDSTPLFLVLLCDYYAWTGDLELVRELLPNVQAALSWLDTYGDADSDGFLEYESDPNRGLVVQSWKDSSDSMSHRDGRPARSPVAVSEAQGYAYDARHRMAPMLARLGQTALAERLNRQAEELKRRFNEAYWMDDRGYLAIALDGEKAQVGTVASDAGHCLWSGIVDAAHAAGVARRLVAPDLFSGWGIRTLSTEEGTYNPMSYHNGSVWPHDTSLCVLGLKRYGYDREAAAVAAGVFAAASHFEIARLPELFCGYSKAEGSPVEYPVACSPQAWAAAAPITLLQAVLGLAPDAASGVLRLRPHLPELLGRLSVRGLRVGNALVDLDVTRDACRATVREGTLNVIVEPVLPAAGG